MSYPSLCLEIHQSGIYVYIPRANIRAYSYVLLNISYVRLYITPVQVRIDSFVLVFRVLVYSRQTANINKYEIVLSWLSDAHMYCVPPGRYCYRQRDVRRTLSAVVEESTLL